MKWKDKKEELNKLINEDNVSYEEIGRIYGCSGGNIRMIAKRLCIDLPSRRVKTPKETFNRGTAEKSICQNCGKEITLYKSTNGFYCSIKCFKEHKHKQYIERWKKGEENGLKNNGFTLSKHIRRYLFEKNDSKCEKCGWGEKNEYTGNVPLQVHHIDGDCRNNKEKNLQLLCPNCHALTENFGSRNKNATKGRSEYYGRVKKKNK